jgi:hypothetical protein
VCICLYVFTNNKYLYLHRHHQDFFLGGGGRPENLLTNLSLSHAGFEVDFNGLHGVIFQKIITFKTFNTICAKSPSQDKLIFFKCFHVSYSNV